MPDMKMMKSFAKDRMAKAPPGFAKHFAGQKPEDAGPAPIAPPEGADMADKKPGDKVQIVIEGTVTEDGMVKPETWNGIPWDGETPKPDMDDSGGGDDHDPLGGGDDEPPEAA